MVGSLLTMFVGWWVWGFGQYASTQVVRKDAYEVYVTGKQWMWKFDYPNGRSTAGVLYVPEGRDVRLLLTSRDVIHSFFVPDFRLKQDAVPGRYFAMSFRTEAAGHPRHLLRRVLRPGPLAHVGPGGGALRPRVRALGRRPDAHPGRSGGPWVSRCPLTTEQLPRGRELPEGDLSAQGRVVAAQKGCAGCHSVDGRTITAPTWLNLWHTWEPLQNGDSVFVDAAYITESMMDPMAKIVRGFPPIMPSFQGQVSPAETAAIVEYIRSLAQDDEEEDGG